MYPIYMLQITRVSNFTPRFDLRLTVFQLQAILIQASAPNDPLNTKRSNDPTYISQLPLNLKFHPVSLYDQPVLSNRHLMRGLLLNFTCFPLGHTLQRFLNFWTKKSIFCFYQLLALLDYWQSSSNRNLLVVCRLRHWLSLYLLHDFFFKVWLLVALCHTPGNVLNVNKKGFNFNFSRILFRFR